MNVQKKDQEVEDTLEDCSVPYKKTLVKDVGIWGP